MGSQERKRGNRLSSLFTLGGDSRQTEQLKNVKQRPSESNLLETPALRGRDRSPKGRPRHSFSGTSPAAQYLTPPLTGEQWTQQPTQENIYGGMSELALAPPEPPFCELSGSRPASPSRSRPASRATSPAPLGLERPGSPVDGKKRRSWLPTRSRNASPHVGGRRSSSRRAWITAGDSKLPYDVSVLETAQKAWDLWDESGDTYIYLFPRRAKKAPSFKVQSSILASSATLTFLAYGGIYSDARGSGDSQRPLANGRPDMTLNVPASPPMSPQPDPQSQNNSQGSQGSRTTYDSLEGPVKDTHLYFPTGLSDEDYGGPMEPRLSEEDVEQLVAVRNLIAFLTRQPVVETPAQPSYFEVFLRIAALLKTFEFGNIDGSTFGETAMSNFEYYVRELGLDDVRNSREKTIEGIVLGERMRHFSLYNEAFVHGVGKYDDIDKLESPKYRQISHITRTRLERAAIDLDNKLRTIRGRLNDFEFPSMFAGLANSTTLPEAKQVDFKQWKSSFLTMRKFTLSFYKEQYGSWPPKARSKKNNFEESGLNRICLKRIYYDFSQLYDLLVNRTSMTTRSIDYDSGETSAIRKVMSEFDRSSPPVNPPVPFDTPRLPYPADVKKRKPKDDELDRVLSASYNPDSNVSTPFLDAYKVFERKQCHGHTTIETNDQRYGHWLFLYCIMQSLPLLVIDAPGVRWGEGVEYFLCQPPKGGVPWANHARKTSWYSIADGKMVNLPSDVVEYGVEGIFLRSHAWEQAAKWGASTRDKERKSVTMLEALPVPEGVNPQKQTRSSRASSVHDPNMTFDNILGR